MNAVNLPAGWPDGKRLAVSVNIMCEAWTDDAAPGIGPMGNPLKAGVLDTQAKSWAEYGMTTGAYRLLDIVGEAGVPCGTYATRYRRRGRRALWHLRQRHHRRKVARAAQAHR
jgi:hypothetical protein